MRFFEDIEKERDRIQACIKKYGHTSDHNLDWWSSAMIADEIPVFVEFSDGGLLTHRHSDKWRIWSDPLTGSEDVSEKIEEFTSEVLKDDKIREVWCDDVSDKIHPELKSRSGLRVNEVFYSLYWPVLDTVSYKTELPGGHFKEMRNAKNKFYREHKVEIVDARSMDKKELLRIVDDWKKFCRDSKSDPDYIYDMRYRRIIDKGFRGFDSARVIIADGQPVGFNAGYEVPNKPGRFGGIIGLHDYSLKDLGIILWLEDLDWIKNAGYREIDLQGDEEQGGLKLKLRFGAKVERKTDTFSISF